MNPLNQLETHDLQDILTIGRTALECDDLREFQEQTFRLMEGCIGASSGVYLQVSGTASAWRFKSGLAHGVPSEGPKVWCSDYADQDPFVARFLENPDNDKQVVVSSEIVSHKDFVRTRFYQEFLRPQSVYHIMILGLVQNARPIGLFGFHRGAGAEPFSRLEAEKALLLAPYLSAAAQKIRASEMAEERETIIRSLANDIPFTGVIILNQEGEPVYDYGKAADLLKTGPGRRSQDGPLQLPAEIMERCEKVRRGLSWRQGTEFHERFDLKQPDGPPLKVHLHPYDCGARGLRFLVYLGPGKPDAVDRSQLERFGFTRRQIDIVNLVSLGMTNPEIAKRLCISVRTVQNHLRSIYLKVNVRNRTSLVSKLTRQS